MNYYLNIIIKRRDWDLNPGGHKPTRFPVLRLTKLDYLGTHKIIQSISEHTLLANKITISTFPIP